jgi:hypothetical protein
MMRRVLVALALCGLVAGHANGQVLTAPASIGVWEDAVVSATAINPTGPADAMTPIASTTGYFGCFLATAAGSPSASVVFQFPHAHMVGTNGRPHLHLVKTDAADNAGTAPFQAKFRHCGLFGTCSAWTDWVTGDVVGDAAGSTTPPDGLDKTFLVAWELANSTYQFTPSSLIVMQIQRAGGTSGDVALCSADLHYRRGSNGTVREGSR